MQVWQILPLHWEEDHLPKDMVQVTSVPVLASENSPAQVGLTTFARAMGSGYNTMLSFNVFNVPTDT